MYKCYRYKVLLVLPAKDVYKWTNEKNQVPLPFYIPFSRSFAKPLTSPFG
jgi:hypothetical protein